MEVDLDLADKLNAIDSELSGDDLMFAQYSTQKPLTTATSVHKSYNNILYASSTNDFKSKITNDPVLHRPTTPGQLRQSIVAHTVDSLANSLVVGDMFHSQTNGFELSNRNSTIFAASTSISMKKPLSANTTSTITNNNNNNVNSTKKISKTSTSLTRPKSANRLSSNDQQKQVTPVLAFGSNDNLDRSIPTIPTQKMTPPMKFSFSEPPRSNSSASIRSSTSSATLELSNGSINNQKTKKF